MMVLDTSLLASPPLWKEAIAAGKQSGQNGGPHVLMLHYSLRQRCNMNAIRQPVRPGFTFHRRLFASRTRTWANATGLLWLPLGVSCRDPWHHPPYPERPA